MQSRLTHARGWFLKAESDLAAARRVVEGAWRSFWPSRLPPSLTSALAMWT